VKDKALIFIAGIPASGKTYFGNWLAREKKFVHVNLEANDQVKLGLGKEWDRACGTPGSAHEFVKGLKAMGRDVVVTWGFPPPCLFIVERLIGEGMEPWWFDGDHKAAEQAYMLRPGAHPPAFYEQMGKISAARVSIEKVFGVRAVATVLAGPSFTPCQEVQGVIFGAAGGA
jgi:hypothetical protein